MDDQCQCCQVSVFPLDLADLRYSTVGKNDKYCISNIIIIIIIRVFCPRADPSLKVQEPRLQFCRRQVFHRKLRNQGCSFTRNE